MSNPTLDERLRALAPNPKFTDEDEEAWTFHQIRAAAAIGDAAGYARGRAEAFEEAARVAEDFDTSGPSHPELVADAIRTAAAIGDSAGYARGRQEAFEEAVEAVTAATRSTELTRRKAVVAANAIRAAAAQRKEQP